MIVQALRHFDGAADASPVPSSLNRREDSIERVADIRALFGYDTGSQAAAQRGLRLFRNLLGRLAAPRRHAFDEDAACALPDAHVDHVRARAANERHGVRYVLRIARRR